MKVICYYCDQEKDRDAVEMDHFPIPDRHGGTETVPACTICHTLKDRIPMSRWPGQLADMGANSLTEEIQHHWPEFNDLSTLIGEHETVMLKPRNWELLPWAGRLVLAKWIFIRLDRVSLEEVEVEVEDFSLEEEWDDLTAQFGDGLIDINALRTRVAEIKDLMGSERVSVFMSLGASK